MQLNLKPQSKFKLSRKTAAVLLLSILLIFTVLLLLLPASWLRRAYLFTAGRFFRHSVESRLADFANAAAERLGNPEIPEQLIIAAFKQEKFLELWGVRASGEKYFIKRYPIIAASGVSGPKLREGDKQVPEGIYSVESLHPNSYFYLALKIAYPSKYDVDMAKKDGRDINNLGSAIMLHGSGGSIGCIAVSDRDIEEIFFLAAKTGTGNIRLLISPFDFRRKPFPQETDPAWLAERYRRLNQELQSLIPQ